MGPALLCFDPRNAFGPDWKRDLRASGYDLIESRNVSDIQKHPQARMAILCAGEPGDEPSLASVIPLRRAQRRMPAVLLVDHGSEQLAVAALRAGFDDYFHMPAETEAFLESVRAGVARTSANTDDILIGASEAMLRTKARLMRVAASDSSVLITGETGTGKELAASMVHEYSARAGGPFVCVNCAAIPDTLIESELFGHERGAFTGAAAKRPGWLETADRGTLFLDEIGDLSATAQAKLLRVIENKSYYRVGGCVTVSPNVRFVAATHRNLEQMAADGAFRRDLFYRLNVARVHIPPLRERREDIPLLLQHYIRRFASDSRGLKLTQEVRSRLEAHDWPGNVRELKNVLESLAINAEDQVVRWSDLPPALRGGTASDAGPQSEREQILAALLCTKWNKSKAAQQLHWSRMTLYRKLSTYRLEAPH